MMYSPVYTSLHTELYSVHPGRSFSSTVCSHFTLSQLQRLEFLSEFLQKCFVKTKSDFSPVGFNQCYYESQHL